MTCLQVSAGRWVAGYYYDALDYPDGACLWPFGWYRVASDRSGLHLVHGSPARLTGQPEQLGLDRLVVTVVAVVLAESYLALDGYSDLGSGSGSDSGPNFDSDLAD